MAHHKLPHKYAKVISSKWFSEAAMVGVTAVAGVVIDRAVDHVPPHSEHAE
jgi:hypothetical protein